MKFISNILPRLRSQQFKFKMSYLWALGIIFILITLISLLSSRFIFSVDKRIKEAVENGQRVEIALKTGTVTGKTSKPAQTESKETPNTLSEDNIAVQKNEPAIQDEKEISKEEDKQLAWIKQDFIGPKLPDEIIEALLGDELTKNKLMVDRISIKEISNKPVVVIIIKGMGLSSSSTKEALELPKEITMGFSPYSPILEEWAKKTKAEGHEIVLNIPMETKDFHTDNPGPYSLITQASDEDNTTRLKMLLGLTKGFDAIYSDSNEIFTHNATSAKPVLELLKKENKYFVYGGGYANYSMIQMADSIGYPILVNDIVLDDDISANAINDKFKEMEKVANEKGYVVVMAHPYPITVRMLKVWLSKTDEKGLVVRPVSLLLGKVFK